MNVGETISKCIEIIKLNVLVIRQVAADAEALLPSLGILAIGGFLAGLGSYNPIAACTGIVFAPVFAFIWVAILHLVASLFGGKGEYMGLFNTWAHGPGLLGWLQIIGLIPILGWIIIVGVWIWQLVIGIVIVSEVHELTRGKAAAVVLIPIAIFAVCCGAAVFIALAMGFSLAALGAAAEAQ